MIKYPLLVDPANRLGTAADLAKDRESNRRKHKAEVKGTEEQLATLSYSAIIPVLLLRFHGHGAVSVAV